MKEAFWGVLIVILGLFGIVVVNIFQNVTVDNDRVYYLIKESTEAAAFDALDLTYYRLSGNLRIVEDKFVENLTRRFAESVTIGDYTIIVEDINEMPPKVSLRVRSGITSLRGEEFGIVNRVDAIIETKYSLDEVLKFLGITKDEWDKKTSNIYSDEKNDEGEKVCNVPLSDDLECMPGDIKFAGFEDVTLQNAVCKDETPKSNVERIAKYKTCNCGKWEEAEEKVYANPESIDNEHIYTWNFIKEGEIRTINETIKGRVKVQECTNDIGIMVPHDIDIKKPADIGDDYYTNSQYITCPTNGIRVPLGMKFVLHPEYIPSSSVNRYLKWSVADNNILAIQYDKVDDENDDEKIKNHWLNSCVLNADGTNCLSKLYVTAKDLGTTYINVATTRGQTSSCKVEVFDGKVDDLACKNLQLSIGESDMIDYDYNPKNATVVGVEYSISNEKIAKINGNIITAEAGGTATISVKEISSGKIGTCTITIEKPPSPPDKISGGSTGSSNLNGYYKVVDAGGNITYHSSLKEAEEAALKASHSEGSAEIFYKSPNTNGKEIKYSYVENKENWSGGKGEYNIVIYNGSSTPVGESKVTVNDNGTYIYVWDMDGNLISKEVIENPNKNTSNNTSGSSSKKQNTLEDAKDKPTGTVTTVTTNSGKPVGVTTCLEEGTEVLTVDGYKNIEEISVGDLVLSYNEKTKNTEYKRVTNVYVHKDSIDVLYSIFVNSKYVEATELHKFYVKTNNGYDYVSVKNLRVGDLLVDSQGNYYPIKKINDKIKKSNYYDIEVEDNHNYYVTKNNILVHNVAVKQPDPPSTTTTTKKTTTKTTTKKTTTKKTTTKKATTKKQNGCFLAGTKVLTQKGYVDIDKIRINDMVLSYNESTGNNEYKKVTNIYIHKNNKDFLYTLTIGDKFIEATSAHRFYVKTKYGGNWVEAQNLNIGDELMDSDGKYYKITKISSKNIVDDVYNLEVEDNHNYYVTKWNILVHNAKVMR